MLFNNFPSGERNCFECCLTNLFVISTNDVLGKTLLSLFDVQKSGGEQYAGLANVKNSIYAVDKVLSHLFNGQMLNT